MDINRRLNDLLNQKDEEITQLNNQIMELKMGSDPTRQVASPGGKQPFRRSDDVLSLENRLKESERLNKEYQQEIKAM
jgi:hypothetical protein